MKADRVGQVWEVGDRIYLVVNVQEAKESRVVYDALILDSDNPTLGNMRTLVEHGEGSWEKMSFQKRLT